MAVLAAIMGFEGLGKGVKSRKERLAGGGGVGLGFDF